MSKFSRRGGHGYRGAPKAESHNVSGGVGRRSKLDANVSAQQFSNTAKYTHPFNKDGGVAQVSGTPMRGGIRL